MQNWILRHIYKIRFFYFLSRFARVLTSKFAKSANMTKKIIFSNYFNMGTKKRRIWCWVESVEKVAKKFPQGKLHIWELLYTVLKVEKVHNSYTFMQITFFVGIFLQLFQRIRNQHQILRFLIPISK